MHELPAEAVALMTFHLDVQTLFASAARDWSFGLVVAVAAACGFTFMSRTWAIYSAIALVSLFVGLNSALETLQASLAT